MTWELHAGISQTLTEVRVAADLLRRLIACRLSHGKVLHIQSRHVQHQVGSAAEAAGWDCKIVWQVESLKELKWIQENLERFNRMYRDKRRGFEKIGAERPEVLGDRS